MLYPELSTLSGAVAEYKYSCNRAQGLLWLLYLLIWYYSVSQRNIGMWGKASASFWIRSSASTLFGDDAETDSASVRACHRRLRAVCLSKSWFSLASKMREAVHPTQNDSEDTSNSLVRDIRDKYLTGMHMGMGAPDWAGRTIGELKDEFGISEKRALRITTLVRSFVSNPKYDDVFAEHGTNKQREQNRVFISEITESLREESGVNIEERWNNLMDKRDIPGRTDEPVYLRPWPEVKDKDPETTHGYTTERRV